MSKVDDILRLRKLENAKGDVRAQAVITADFGLFVQFPNDREKLASMLDAAVVLHWFDVPMMAHMLQVDETEARRRINELRKLPFVEEFRLRESSVWNIHDATRFGWRSRLAREQSDVWRELSARAAAWFAVHADVSAKIEYIYHRLSADPVAGAQYLEELNRQWSNFAEHSQSLALTVWELETFGLVSGNARLEVLLCSGDARMTRGEGGR